MQKTGWIILVALIWLGCKGKQDQAENQQPIKAQAGVLTPTPVNQLPDGVLAWAALGNPHKLIENAEKMVSKTSPLPAGVLSSSITQALIPLGFKDTRVIDLSSPAGVLLLNPTQYNPPVLIALTTTGEKAVLESIKGTWSQDAQQDGIHQLSRQVVNPQAVFQGAGDAKKTKQTLFVKFVGPTAIAAMSREALQKGGQVLLEQLKRSAPAQGMQAALQVENVRKGFQAQLAMIPMMLKTQATQKLNNTMPQESNNLISKLVDWYIDKIMALFNQTAQVGLALGVDQSGAVLHLSLAPVNNSFFQKFLASQRPSKLELVRFLPTEAPFAMAVDVQWQTVKADIMEMSKEFLSVLSKPELQQKIMPLISQWMDTMGDQVAVSQNMSDKGLNLVEVFEIKDETKAKTLLTDLLQSFMELLKDSNLSGFKTKGISTKQLPKYGHNEINQIEIAMDYQALPKIQADMMKGLYGEKIEIAWSVFDKKLALTLGPTAVQEIKKLIDRNKTDSGRGLADSKPFQAAAAGLDKQAGGYLYLSVVNLVLGTLKNNPAMAQSLAKIETPKSQSGMFFSFYQQDGQFVTSMRLPTDHLNEIGELFKSFSN